MVLADTSVWIDHLRRGDAELVTHLQNSQILCHPYIVCELTLGMLKQRETVLAALRNLPQATLARENEVLEMIERRTLFGHSIGYIDAHLLTSVALTQDTRLWTRDKRLRKIAEQLGCDANL